MFRGVRERIRQKHRTGAYPGADPVLPDRFRGRPVLNTALCPPDCLACLEACPTGAIAKRGGALSIDLGRCLFCTDCAGACPAKAVSFTTDHRLAATRREDLLQAGGVARLAEKLQKRSLKLFGRSLKLRQVCAGGCNACEADLQVLSTLVFDLGRFGVEFVASPRHADGVVVTGPVTVNMRLALAKCLAAVPEPRIVVASGACAISGGPYIGLPECSDGASGQVKVDLFIPGCPPHPYTALDGLLRLLGRL